MMNGYEYEKWCAQWLKRQGYRNVQITRASHDQGIDIIAVRHQCRTGFQCKYYDAPVSNAAVQQAYTGSAYYGCEKAAVITNSVFTASAIEAAEKLDVTLYSHIQPESVSRFTRLRRFFIILLFIAGVLLFLSCTFLASFPFRMNDAVISILLCFSSACIWVSDDLVSMHVLSIVLLIYPLVFVLNHMAGQPLVFAAAGLILEIFFSLFHMISLLKEKNVSETASEKEELHQKIEDNTRAVGETIARMLEESLQTEITVKEGSFQNDVCTYTFHAAGNIADDLPLAVYDINQLYQSEPYYLEYEIVNTRLFRIRFLQIGNQ